MTTTITTKMTTLDNRRGAEIQQESSSPTKKIVSFPTMECRDLDSLETLFLSIENASISSSSSSLPRFLSEVLLVHRELMEDEANPISSPIQFDALAPQEMLVRRLSASSTSSNASSVSMASVASSNGASEDGCDALARGDDRVERLCAVIREAPWKIDAEELRSLKSGGASKHQDAVVGGAASTAWGIGQLLRAALYVAHCVLTEDIIRLLREGDAETPRLSASPSLSTLTTSSSSSPRPSPLRDFNWTDQGFPLLEALGMEEAAATLDRKAEMVARIVEEEGEEARRVWETEMMRMGIEDDDVGDEEDEEDVDQDYAAELISSSSSSSLMMKIIRAEARNHAVILQILNAVEKLVY